MPKMRIAFAALDLCGRLMFWPEIDGGLGRAPPLNP
jgi:hypothetical protein